MARLSADEQTQIERSVRAKAHKRVRVRLGFYWHSAVFTLGNLAMVAINLTYSPQHIWFAWPLAGWGSALLLHGLATFQGTGVSEAMVEAEVRRELVRRGVG